MEIKIWFKDTNGNEIGGAISFDCSKIAATFKNWLCQQKIEHYKEHIKHDYYIAITDGRYRLNKYIYSYFKVNLTENKLVDLIDTIKSRPGLKDILIIEYLNTNKITYEYSGELNGFENLPEFNIILIDD